MLERRESGEKKEGGRGWEGEALKMSVFGLSSIGVY